MYVFKCIHCFKHKKIFLYYNVVRHKTKDVKIEPKFENISLFLSEQFKVSRDKIEVFLTKNPYFHNYEKDHIIDIKKILGKYILHEDMLQHPKLFRLKPINLKYHAGVLSECGFENKVIGVNLSSYLTLVSKNSIENLKAREFLPSDTIVQNLLELCLPGWPARPAFPDGSAIPDAESTLQQARMRVLARYLELNLDLPVEEFHSKLTIYPRIKHRPLRVIGDLIHLLQNNFMMTNRKILTHFAVLQAHPSNIKAMMKNVGSLADVDLREIAQMKPNILTVNYRSILKIRDTMNEFGISHEQQRRCFDIFTLSEVTVRDRILSVLNDSELSVHFHNPRFLRLILYKSKVDARKSLLENKNKKCISLNVLSGCSDHYKSYAHTRGDKTRGRDTTQTVYSLLGDAFSYTDIHSCLQKHPYYNHVPSENIFKVFNYIKQYFDVRDIFLNCQLVLYPEDCVKYHLRSLLLLRSESSENEPSLDFFGSVRVHGLDFTKLSNFSLLSLALYFLEKDHHFSGDGIWSPLVKKLHDPVENVNANS